MQLLVTGATGFLGYRTLEYLLQQPGVDSILATGRTLKPTHTHQHPKLRYQLGDLSDSAFVASLFEKPITHVVNCASLSSPWGAYQAFYRANCLSQQYLIQHSERNGVQKFVYISSPSVYFTGTDRLQISEDEALPKKFVNAYAATKHEAEQLLTTSRLAFITLRPRALIGRGDTVIMPRLIRSQREGKLKTIGKGDTLADLTHVANVAHAIWLALQAPPAAIRQVYNISNGEPVMLWTYIEKVLQELSLNLPKQKVPERVAYIAAQLMEWSAQLRPGSKEPALTTYSIGTLTKSMTLDISKAQKLLGYSPQYSIQEGLDEFIAWYKNLSADGIEI